MHTAPYSGFSRDNFSYSNPKFGTLVYHSKNIENSVAAARNWRMICSPWRRYMHGLKVVLLQSGDTRFGDSP